MPAKTATRKGSSRPHKGWKQTQSNIQTKKKTKLAIFVLLGIVLLILMGQLLRLSHALMNPWRAEVPKNIYTWDDNFTINLIIKDSNISTLSFIPSEKKIVIIKLPDNLLIDVPSGFGSWQLRSVFELGESGKKGQGLVLLKSTVSSFLGLPIDGVLQFENNESTGEDLIEHFRKEANIFKLISNIRSDLTLWEIIRLKLALSSVRFDKVDTIDLEELLILDDQILADGTKVVVGENVALDSITSNLSDPILKDEHKSVVVFNATEKPLLAQSAGRLIGNLGVNVIAVSNSEIKSKKTFIIGEESKSFERLMQIFDKGCTKDQKCDKISADELGAASHRADIIVVLGDDYL